MIHSFWNRQDHSSRTNPSGKRTIIITLITLFVALLSACTEDPSSIGIKLLPDDDFISIHSTDTVSVRAYTMYIENSLSSDSTRMIAGSVRDSYFGTTHCDFVTQLRVMVPWTVRPFDLDSVLLTFVPTKVSGDTLGNHYLRLYETGTLLTDSIKFFSNQDPDTIRFMGEYLLPKMEDGEPVFIRIDQLVGWDLMRDTSIFSRPTEFYTDFFKGLYFGIRSEEEPLLLEMDVTDSPGSQLAITVFYHTVDNETQFNYSFVATQRAVNYNRFIHDRSTADPGKEIVHVNDMVADSKVFLQTLQGLFVRLDMPSLEAFRSIDNLAVNKARLVAPVFFDEEYNSEEELPAMILVRYRDSEGREIIVPDLLLDPSFMDGTYERERGSFIFNITTFVQQYLDEKIEEPSVELFLPLAADNNVIFNANDNDPGFRLELVWSTF